MSMPVRAVSNERDERRSNDLIRALSDFTKQHRAAHWAGTFASFLESVFPADARAIARSSHQYMWDMMRAQPTLFQDELYGIDDTIERVADYFKAAAAGSEVGRRLLLLLGPPSGGKSSIVILLKRGLEEYSHTDAGALYGDPRLPGARVAAAPRPAHPARAVPRHLRRRDHRRAVPALRHPPAARVQRRLHADAGAAHLHLAKPAASASAPTRRTTRRTADIADLVGSVDLSKVVGVRRRGRSARLVVVGRGVRRQPRHARDDRDPEGEARVPLPAADADAGEERQGVALPADPPRRDDPRAHQPRGVPQVPAGAGERGAARPHGDHPGALHALLQGRGADLPQAHLVDAGVPRGAPRPARAARRRGVRGAHAPRRRARAKATAPKKVRLHAGEDVEGVSRHRGRARSARAIPTRAWPACRRASSSTRCPTRSSSRAKEPDHHGRAASR